MSDFLRIWICCALKELDSLRVVGMFLPKLAGRERLVFHTHSLTSALPVIEMTDEEFHERQIGHIKGPADDASEDEKKTFSDKLKKFTSISTYISGAYDQDDGFQHLLKEMEKIESKRKDQKSGPHRLFYMALPPSVFTVVAKGLKKNCYSEKGINRIVIEKPFGKDLESCREMMEALKSQWTEDETYRIDHYLGKEMVKNLLILRFGNIFLESSLNRNFVSNVQITFKEPFGTEGRGGYFDEFGIIRDVCQNREWRFFYPRSQIWQES